MPRNKEPFPAFVALYKVLLKDPEWRALSSSAKVLYTYLRNKFHPDCLMKTPYAEVTLAYSEMEDIMTTRTMSSALKELESATVAKLKITEASSNGATILNELIEKGVVKDFSPTAVRFKPKLNGKEEQVREIAKNDFNKIWVILQKPNGFIQKTKYGGLMGGLCRYKFIGPHGFIIYNGVRV